QRHHERNGAEQESQLNLPFLQTNQNGSTIDVDEENDIHNDITEIEYVSSLSEGKGFS
ncbi:hypothetical protein A2U01_0013242, partial [Trifolium medium]|nr:hypothetical protein [Trifolium medium]